MYPLLWTSLLVAMQDYIENTPSARSKFWGLSGSEDRGGGDNSIQFINFGRVGDKSFEEWWQKIGGWKGGWQQYFDFFVLLYQIRNPTFNPFIFIHICLFVKLKKLHVGQFFLLVFVIYRTSLLVWRLCHQTRNRTYFTVFSGPDQFY